MRLIQGTNEIDEDRMRCPCCSAGQTFPQHTQHSMRYDKVFGSYRGYRISVTRFSYECDECGHAQATEDQNHEFQFATEMKEAEIDFKLLPPMLELVKCR